MQSAGFCGTYVPVYCGLAHSEDYQLELSPFSQPGLILLDLRSLRSSVTFEMNVSLSSD